MHDLQIIDKTAKELQNINPEIVDRLIGVFTPLVGILKKFEPEYEKIIEDAKTEITPEVIERAKSLRIRISKVRIEAEKSRKNEKDDYLRAGKAIDWVGKKIKDAVSDKEKELEDIEKYFELLKAKMIESNRAERVRVLTELFPNDPLPFSDLGQMEEEMWAPYLEGRKKTHAEKIAEEKRKEEERQKELERQRAIEVENARLKAEQALREKEIQEERTKLLAEQAKREQALQEEQERRQKELQAERDRIRLENMKQLEAERAKIKLEQAEKEKRLLLEREKLEAEKKRRELEYQAAREKAKQDEAMRAKELEEKRTCNDDHKMIILKDHLRSIYRELRSEYKFTSEPYSEKMKNFLDNFVEIIKTNLGD